MRVVRRSSVEGVANQTGVDISGVYTAAHSRDVGRLGGLALMASDVVALYGQPADDDVRCRSGYPPADGRKTKCPESASACRSITAKIIW